MAKWENIVTHLKNEGFDVFAPGAQPGICVKHYIVVVDGTQIADAGSKRVGQQIFDVILYLPINQYSRMGTFKKQVKASMLKLVPGIRATGTETPVVIEDTFKAQSMSIEYTVYKKLK